MADIIIEGPKRSKKWLWVLLIIIIIIALGVVYYFWKIADKNSEPSAENSEVVVSGQLPEGFPKILPIKSGVVLQTKEMQYEGGTLWEVSYLTDERVWDLYSSYFDNIAIDGWVISNSSDTGGEYFIVATKNNEALNINFNREIDDNVFVVIAYTIVK